MASAKQKLRDTFGTAPRRISATEWVTRTGRRLTPAGAAYWERKYQQGLYDARGHNLLKTRGFVGASEEANRRAAERARAASALTSRAEQSSDYTGTTRMQRAEKYARATGDTTAVFDIARATGATSPLLRKSAIIDNAVTRDVNAIVSGFPRLAWITGRDVVGQIVHPSQNRYALTEDVFRPMGEAYKEKYVAPFLEGGGGFGQLLHNIGQTPVSSALDASAVLSGAAMLGKAGGLRYTTPRVIPTGTTEVGIVPSPNPLAEFIQRQVVDPFSVRAQQLRDQGVPIPARFTSDVRAAKQTHRDLELNMRRVRAAAAQDLNEVLDIPRAARTRAWYEIQTPEAARGGEAVQAAAARLRELADQTLSEGTVSERFRASQPTQSYLRAVQERDRIQQQLGRLLSTRAGEALRRRPKPRLGASDAVVLPPGRTLRPVEPAAEAASPEAAPLTGIEATRARFAEVDTQFQKLVDRAAKGLTSMFTKAEKDRIYKQRVQYKKENVPKPGKTSTRSGHKGFQQFNPKTPGEQARDLAIERLYRFAETAPDTTPGIQGLRDLLAEHDRLSQQIRHDDPFADLPTKEQLEAARPAPELVQVSRIAAKAAARPARQPIGPREINAADLRGALAVANDRVRRLGQPRPVRRNADLERAEATRQLTAAAQAEASAAHTYNPAAVESAGRLMDERTQILVDAGKLDPEDAAARTGAMSRELGFEPTGAETYVGHRMKEGWRTRFGLASNVERPPRVPEGVGQELTMRGWQSGRVVTDTRKIAQDWQAAQAYKFQNDVRDYLGKVARPLGEGETPRRGWYVIDPDGQQLPRDWKYVDPVAKADAEGIRVEEAVARDINDYVNNYIAKADTPEASALIEKAQQAGHQLGQVAPEVVWRLVGRRNVGGTTTLAGEAFNAVSDLTKASLIYLNPGYVPANLVGNTLFGLVHQGPALVPNTARAIARIAGAPAKGLSRPDVVELRHRLRAEIGPGPTVAITGGAGGPVHDAVLHVARAEGLVADDIIRLAGWVREARKQGVKTPAEQLDFLRKAAEGDPEAAPLAKLVEQRMANAMGDFNRMGPTEKRWAQKYLFVWAWVRAASRYPFTTARDYPIRTALIARGSENAAADERMDTPPVPYWLGEAFKVGPGRYANFRSVSNINTFPDAVQTLMDAFTGRNQATVLDFANPLLRVGSRVGLGETQYGERVGFWKALASNTAPLSPLANTIEEVLQPSKSSKVYGKQTAVDVLKRRLGRGVIPFSIDEREAYKAARKTMPKEKQIQGDAKWLMSDYTTAARKAKIALPKSVKDALAWREYRDLARLDYENAHPDLFADGQDKALHRYAGDLATLVKAGRLTEGRADAMWNHAWQLRQKEATKGRLSGLQGDLNQGWFYQRYLTHFDAQLKARDVAPPRRD